MSDIQLAIKFIQDHGTILEKSRLHVLLQEQALIYESINDLTRSQRQDGGWAPFWAADESSIDATCYRLAQCEQLGLSAEKFIAQAIAFLRARQNTDGSFEEDISLQPVAPPWAKPGDLSAKLYITANAGYWIHHFEHSTPSLINAGQFLMSHLNAEGFLPTFLHANWLSAGLLYSLGEHAVSESILRYLHSKLAELEASNLAWLVNALSVVGIPSHHTLMSGARHRLQNLQQADGRWVSEDGEWQDVHTTLEAIRALHFLAPR